MTPRPELILASASSYKRRLLERLAIPFTCQPADIDETPRPGEKPLALAMRLAREKAAALASSNPQALVLGCDQVIAAGDQIFSKPQTSANAGHQLHQLQGKTHELINAIHLLGPAGIDESEVVTYSMTMRPLSQKSIESYVAQDQPLDCAGSYRIESLGIRLFTACQGDDPTAIEGLPLTRVWSLLLRAGWCDE